jgi:Tol biopolymer transport system component
MGGAPRKLRDDAYGWAVSRDGAWVAFTAKPTGVFYREMWRMRPDGEQATKLYEGDENSGFFGADWSPDGERLSYVGAHLMADKLEMNIESRNLKGSPAVIAGSGDVADWTWSPDGRMIYILPEASPLQGSCNFWEIHVDARTGKPTGFPTRLTNWAGFCMQDPTVTADGTRLAFRKLSPQGTVYVADVQTNGTRISTARHFTLNEGQDYPIGWTPDGKAVVFESYRDGKWSIFKQWLDQDTAEPIVTGVEDEGGISATVSSNGAWLLYVAPPITSSSSASGSSSTSAMDRLMRVSMMGGPPELVLTGSIYGKIACARSPANLCAVAELSSDHKELIFTAFDPEKGRGRELARFDTERATRYMWALSPDGTRIAILKYSNGFIDLLPLDGQAPEKIVVNGWSNILSLNWESDGRGIFASSQTKTGSVLLRISLTGVAHVIWKQNGSIAPWNRPFASGDSAPFGVPSPDGRHLAIYGWNMSSNMWMIENF